MSRDGKSYFRFKGEGLEKKLRHISKPNNQYQKDNSPNANKVFEKFFHFSII